MKFSHLKLLFLSAFLGACASKHGVVPVALWSSENPPAAQAAAPSPSTEVHDQSAHNTEAAHTPTSMAEPVKIEVHGSAAPVAEAVKTEIHGAAAPVSPASVHGDAAKKDEHASAPMLPASVRGDAAKIDEHLADPHASKELKNKSHAEVSAIGATQLQWLKNGNSRFVKNHQRNDFKSRADKKSFIEKLNAGEKPHSIVLSCSDSRVPPELVFDQVMGEIFVIRVAGEALDSSVIASIEYAAEHLGTELVVVMGHESCDAVKAAVTTADGQTAGSANLDKLVADIKPRISQMPRSPAGASTNFRDESWWNAKGVAKDLLTRSPVIAELSHKGKIRIVSALYEIKSGVVRFE